MLVESLCIVLIFAFMAFAFIRRGDKTYGLSALCVAILPFVHLGVQVVSDLFALTLTPTAITVADVIGLAVSALTFGMTAMGIKSKRPRTVYTILGGIFIAALALIYILNNYSIVV